MKNIVKFGLALAGTFALSAIVHAKEEGNPYAPTGYVLCADGTAVAFEIVNGGFGIDKARAECIARHGGVAPQIYNPKAGLTFSEAAQLATAIPKDMIAIPTQAVAEVAAALKDLVRSGSRAEEFRGLIIKNDANGIRQLLMSSGRMPRSSMEAIRRAYIGPVTTPIITIQPEPGPCTASSGMMTYWIGGVLVGQYYDNGCVQQN